MTSLQDGDNVFSVGIHGTSCYSLRRILAMGLLPGTPEMKHLPPAIFSFPCVGGYRAMASSGYVTYSDLTHGGQFWGPRLEVAIPMWRAAEAGGSCREAPWATPVGFSHVVALWVHCIHASERVGSVTWVNADDWHPEYEDCR